MRNPKVIGLLPLRAGSKGVPGKNKKLLLGKPLYMWQVEAMLSCETIDYVVAMTDDNEIIDQISAQNNPRLQWVCRSEEVSSDTASTESVLFEFVRKFHHEKDVIVLAQATNVFTSGKDYADAISLYQAKRDVEKSAVSIVSAVSFHGFLWSWCYGRALPNYDVSNRPRRQDQELVWKENGAFYIAYGDDILSNNTRLPGKSFVYEMPSVSAIEIDTFDDFYLVGTILSARESSQAKLQELSRQFPPLDTFRLLVTDIDGVLTDNKVSIRETAANKQFNLRDQRGIELLQNNGIEVVALTADTRYNSASFSFLEPLIGTENIIVVPSGRSKIEEFHELLYERRMLPEQVIYVGDDYSDIQCIHDAGFSFCPSDSVADVKHIASRSLEKRGGEGTLREISDILKSNITGFKE